MDNTNPAPVAVDKKSKAPIVGMIVLAILALSGAGFGVYGMLKANEKPQPQDLKIQVKEDDGTVTTIDADKIEKTDDDKTIVIADTPVETSSKDYVYIGRWGLKIKVGDELEEVTYRFDYDSDNRGWILSLSGGIKGTQNMPVFGTVEECPLGSVALLPEDADLVHYGGRLVMTNGDRNFYYFHPNGICGPELSMDQEIKTVEAIERILTNPDNYIKF